MIPFKAVLNSADVSTAAAVPIYINGESVAQTMISTDQLRVSGYALTWGGPTTADPADVHVFFSTDGTSPASWQTIVRGQSLAAVGSGQLSMNTIALVAPPGLKIYAKAGAAGAVNIMVLGYIIRK